MRICVPTDGDEGLWATVHRHFGSAPYFSILDTSTGVVEVLPNPNRYHEHGHCHPVAALAGASLEAIAVRGIGRNALNRLAESGIRAYHTSALTVEQLLADARNGTLEAFDPAGVCGRREGHGAGHHHQHHA